MDPFFKLPKALSTPAWSDKVGTMDSGMVNSKAIGEEDAKS